MNASHEKELTDLFYRGQLIVAHDGEQAYEAVVPPIVQTSLFTFSTFEEMVETYSGGKKRYVYSRTTNPSVAAFEGKMAALEETDDAIGFASGMAAISGAVLAFVKPGDRIVCVRHVYPDAYRFFETFLKTWGVTTTYVDGADLDAVDKALAGARLLYLESPTSWTMEAHDVRALAALARKHGALSLIDNSNATSIFQQPVTLGVDLVIHSASKYIGGHSDTVAGVVAGRNELTLQIRQKIHPYIGAKLAPFEAWLLLRGLRTLPIRMEAHERAALDIAGRLDVHECVTRIYHPRFQGELPDGLAGTSGLFSFTVDESIDIGRFCNALKLFKIGVSWGGHESLVVPSLAVERQAGGPNSVLDFGVPLNMIRIHVGLEGAEALWNDLSQALSVARR
jgi:cystathionine beta-lyase/cystathionine gamma-synthase